MRRTADAAAATRTALIEAALREFAELGFATSTLAGVAARAGMTRGAVYHHFADKTALRNAVLDESWDIVAAPLWAEFDRPGRSLRDKLTGFATDWLHALHTDPRFHALLRVGLEAGPPVTEDVIALQAAGYADWQGRLAAALRAAPDELAPDVDPDVAAVHLFAWLCGLCLIHDAGPGALPAADAASVAPMLRGLFR
jgi:TetR/AcrR family acrAB operon transcriptional repressor